MINSVALSKKSYRRGVILGLTMAETIILLMFSLLIAIAGILQKETEIQEQAIMDAVPGTIEEITKQNEILRSELSRAKGQVTRLVEASKERVDLQPTKKEKLAEAVKVIEADKDWRELVIFKKTYDELRIKPTLSQITKHAPVLKSIVESSLVELDEARAIAAVKQAAASSATATTGKHSWPPIINLNEAAGYSFKSGSAELSDEFKNLLGTSIADRLVKIIADYNVNLIEVIGHTDEQPLFKRISNLDRTMNAVLEGDEEIGKLVPADNAGLGLIRAMSVSMVLQNDSRLKDIIIFSYSGAQLIAPERYQNDSDEFGVSESRRRIEIRVRRRE